MQPAGVNKWSSISKMLAAEWMVFILVLLTVVMVIFYWLNNNSLLGNQQNTDGIHTNHSIFPKTGAESKVTLA